MNKTVFLYILHFLKTYIIDQKDVNKMNVHNIAVIFTPCFFRAKVAKMDDLLYGGRYASLLKEILINLDEIAPNIG